MDRRSFVSTGFGGTLGLLTAGQSDAQGEPSPSLRSAFPRVEQETFLNTAGGAPLGSFAREGLERYQDFAALGPGSGREEYVRAMVSEVRGLFGSLIGADETEIGLVHSTKAGEQIVTDALLRERPGANIVTNDLHFGGSLHNLIGLRESGRDVRIVRAVDWRIRLEDMAAAIDEETALVAVTLVSNINGHIEPIREIAEIAHARGALVYADVIQAVGTYPFDVRALGIDFAAANAYKWLLGVHGAGFLYVAREHQGTALPDRLFPGFARPNYPPWVTAPDPVVGEFSYHAPEDARRYQPGHVSYLSYCAAYEGLKFLHGAGTRNALTHSVQLNERLRSRLDDTRYECISPHTDRSPIITFAARDEPALRDRLRAAGVVVSVAANRVRVSPALYNNEDDIDRLIDVLMS